MLLRFRNFNHNKEMKNKITVTGWRFLLCFILQEGLLSVQIKAEFKVAGVFGNNAILQQERQIPVWGSAAPWAKVEVTFSNISIQTVTDASGKWITYLPAMKADGKSYQLNVRCNQDKITFNNIMLGEVWLASGQSNMEFKVASLLNKEEEAKDANYPDIRFRKVDYVTSVIPFKDIPQDNWVICSPQTVKDFSAVAYLYAKELNLKKGVPVGIISSSWGATSIEAWMSSEVLMTLPDFRQRIIKMDHNSEHWKAFVAKNIKAEHDRDSIAKAANVGIKSHVNGLNYDDSSWKRTLYPLDMGKIGLGGFWGIVWFRKSFEFPSELQKSHFFFCLNLKAKEVNLYLNGIEIGHTINPDKVMFYGIPAKLLKSGRNVLSIRMYITWGTANIGTSENDSYLVSSDKKIKIPLNNEWRSSGIIEPPVPQWQNYYNQLSVQYNARIAPLIPYAIRGVIWYQGENNAGKANQYRILFPLMIQDWRLRWNEGYMPFLFVQLPNYMDRKAEPSEESWAEMREAQTLALNCPNTGMACTIDIGEANNIHPRNKSDVGHRLYLAACNIAYHGNNVSSGPVYDSMKIEGDKIRLKFSSCGSGLESKDNKLLKGFAIAGSDQKFYWGSAFIEGNEVVVSSLKVKLPVAVRYGWANNPDCNLNNREGLPAPPFRTDTWKLNNL